MTQNKNPAKKKEKAQLLSTPNISFHKNNLLLPVYKKQVGTTTKKHTPANDPNEEATYNPT